MKKSGGKTEGSMLEGTYPVLKNEYDGKEIPREKQPLENASGGHTGPGGTKNPSEVGGNTEAMLKRLRYGNS